MLLTFQEICEQLRIDGPTCWRLLRDGKMPKPLVIDELVRWPSTVIEGWVADGCPADGEPFGGNSMEFNRLQVAVELEWIAQLESDAAVEEAVARFSEERGNCDDSGPES